MTEWNLGVGAVEGGKDSSDWGLWCGGNSAAQPGFVNLTKAWKTHPPNQLVSYTLFTHFFYSLVIELNRELKET